jgi:hypothetical protein
MGSTTADRRQRSRDHPNRSDEAVAPITVAAPLPVVPILALLDLYGPDEPSCEDGGGVPPYAKLHSINEAIATDKISLSISNLLVFSGENRMEGLGFR